MQADIFSVVPKNKYTQKFTFIKFLKIELISNKKEMVIKNYFLI